MNWGNRIVLAFVCFAAFIGYMATRAFQEDFDLVTEDYYAQEIQYEKKMVKLANAGRSGRVIEISQDIQSVELKFPDDVASGTIHFYHPSRALFDKTYDIQLENGSQTINKTDLVAGNYRVNVAWNVDGKEFLQESKIFIR